MGVYEPRPRWTARQMEFLLANWPTMKDEEIADALGKTLKSVRRRRERLELKKLHGRGVCGAAEDQGLESVEEAKIRYERMTRSATPENPPVEP